MEVQYTGHPQSDVKINLTQEDFAEVNSIMRQAFLESLQFGTYDEITSKVLPDSHRARIIRLCEKFGVDWEYAKDRVSFFKAILEVK